MDHIFDDDPFGRQRFRESHHLKRNSSSTLSIFLDKSPRIVYRMVDECGSASSANAEAKGLGESSSALEPSQP